MAHNPHEGHRDRLRHRFLEHGADSLADHELLELLLFYAIARQDVNTLAHTLLDHFGALHAVFDAPVEEPRRIPGVGTNTAILIKLIPQVDRRYLMSRAAAELAPRLTNAAEAGKYLLPLYHAGRDESVYLLTLDSKCKLLGCHKLADGDLNAAFISVRKIVELALAANATSVILSHNHTSGIALPSRADVATTESIARALKAVGIRLSDHIIVAEQDFVSMNDSGYLSAI